MRDGTAVGGLDQQPDPAPAAQATQRRRLLRRATDIDPAARTVTVTRLDSSVEQVGYDYLVVAVGMRTAYHGNEHLMEHTIGMKTLDDALAIRRKVMGAFEVAETLPDPEQRKPWLTFAIAGGGPTGVELAGQIRELAHNALEREFRSIDRTRRG